MTTDDIIDTFGVPEFFVTHCGKLEDIGHGLMRDIRCIKRGNLLQPVYSVVQPALTVLQINRDMEKIVSAIIRGDGWRN